MQAMLHRPASPCCVLFVQVIEEQHTFLDRQVSLLRCSLEPLNDEDKVSLPGCAGGRRTGGQRRT